MTATLPDSVTIGGMTMLRYKFNVLTTLKENGFNTNRLRKEKLIGEATIQNLRSEKPISWQNIDNICKMLHCQPGDLLEYVDDPEPSEG